MKFDIREKVKHMMQKWLDIAPAPDQTFALTEKTGLTADILRAQLWYRGDAWELFQFFRQLEMSNSS